MVEPETFTLLADLALNNRKAWMDEHREERDDALRNFTGIAITLHDYADRFDPYVADAKIKPKQSYSRFFQEARDRVGPGLYRTDVDVFANAGNPAEDVGYYLHIEPGNCHAGAGLFQPSKAALARLRVRLVDDPQGLNDVLTDPEFIEAFPDGIVTRKALGTVPDGFDRNDPAAPYLKIVGIRDSNGSLSRSQVLDNARSIVDTTNLPVSADLEDGFGASPEDCAQTVREVEEIGLCGGALEDATGDPDNPIYEFEHAVDRIRAAVAAKSEPGFLITARAENFIYNRPDLNNTIRRLQAFEEAGADVV